VYAVHYNHRREAHLNAAVLESAFLRPAVLITDAENALEQPDDRAARDKDFQEAIVTTLRQKGG
jgi:Cft2 family RNA processing exonuclease